MSMTLSAIVDNTTYSLCDGTYCYWVGDEGLGMAPMHRLSERGPLQNGITDRGYRLDPRPVRLVLEINASTQSSWESKRRSLLQIFKPSNSEVINLVLGLETRTYYLDCHYIANLDMPSSSQFGWTQKVVVELLAPDPTWYDPTMNVTSFSASDGADTCEIPMEVPTTIGGATINTSSIITNSGDVSSYPIIKLIGPITNPVITNGTTGDTLEFPALTIGGGDYYEIDCRYGYKTVEDQDGVNQISELSDDSDIATFALEASPTVDNGENDISIYGSSASSSTSIEIRYYTRYIGV